VKAVWDRRANFLRLGDHLRNNPGRRLDGFDLRHTVFAQPRRAASIVAMSIFCICIIASKARFASAPPAANASVSARGVICQDRPQRSLHQPHALSCPLLPTIAF